MRHDTASSTGFPGELHRVLRVAWLPRDDQIVGCVARQLNLDPCSTPSRADPTGPAGWFRRPGCRAAPRPALRHSEVSTEAIIDSSQSDPEFTLGRRAPRRRSAPGAG